MSDLAAADFLGAFAVVVRDGRTLFVANERQIGGQPTRTWDLPGGAVERGELVVEALVRELREETGLQVVGSPRFLFVQEGERLRGGARRHAWRSFFFAVDVAPGQPRAGHEVLDVAWLSPTEQAERLTAPYHDSYRRWLQHGGVWFRSAWTD